MAGAMACRSGLVTMAAPLPSLGAMVTLERLHAHGPDLSLYQGLERCQQRIEAGRLLQCIQRPTTASMVDNAPPPAPRKR